MIMPSKKFKFSPYPLFSNSFETMVIAAVRAAIDERESDRVCLLLKKSRSTAMLTPGIARTSRAMRDKMGK
jgi:hypothetical protein